MAGWLEWLLMATPNKAVLTILCYTNIFENKSCMQASKPKVKKWSGGPFESQILNQEYYRFSLFLCIFKNDLKCKRLIVDF